MDNDNNEILNKHIYEELSAIVKTKPDNPYKSYIKLLYNKLPDNLKDYNKGLKDFCN